MPFGFRIRNPFNRQNPFTSKNWTDQRTLPNVTGSETTSRRGAAESSKASSIPPPPQEVLQDEKDYFLRLLRRPNPHHIGDAPLYSLYRLYEQTVLRASGALKEELAYFYSKGWSITSLTDPSDTDPRRYAVLACVVQLLTRYVNYRIEMESRGEEHFDVDRRGGGLRRKKGVPEWAVEVPALQERLVLNEPSRAALEHDTVTQMFMRRNISVHLPGLDLD